MALTPEQREARRRHIGGSDMACILGLSPYRTAYDIWLEKCGKIEDSPDSDAAHAGSRFERAVLDEAEDRLGKLERNVVLAAPGGLPIATQLDGRVIATGEPVDAKTSGLFGPLDPAWGEEGTDQIPEACIVQMQMQILCSGADVCHVMAFLGGRGFAQYRVARNGPLMDILVVKAVQFWGLVQAGTPPEDSAPSLEVVKLVRRLPGKTVEIPPEVLAKWRYAKDKLDVCEQKEEDAKALLLAALGDAEAGTAGDAGGITYLRQTRSSVNADQLAREQPDIYNRYLKVSSYPVLRYKKPKARKELGQ